MLVEKNCTINETDIESVMLNETLTLLWYFDIDARRCKPLTTECFPPDIPNRFATLNECKEECIANVKDIVTKGILI